MNHAIDVSRETEARLAAFSELLLKWNRTINLIGRASELEVATRHIADSLQLVEHIPAAAQTWIDLGSGGGFPAIPCAIAMPNPPEITLVESDKRKAAFLSTAARTFQLPIKVKAKRVEELNDEACDVLSARALAPLTELLTLSEHLRRKDTVCIFPKGIRAKDEIGIAREAWRFNLSTYPSITVENASILILKDIERA
ncbi:16S rRNA (guanine(527)-N(7))-methyltransferase RsmG [Roseicyclus sp. F158]|uniref:Ribosomal RNA small subunit methyltransferase G n=1 Tax=Tropicimonas omnivorans TaxID=3075590 RepID=A0ABU3DCP0_9RHOB|nr:16S rRNA (guanine(527)-N(7))-methyltransferase RsmG [Roseicyclus sp. F158]MDT0681484.1 16S rRNA (guanine(527)-N(7))-methyltransferase RsmG [Roseicyclus sp. F158]